MNSFVENTGHPDALAEIVDHKAVARERIEEFLSLTVEGMLLQPYKSEVSNGALELYDPQNAQDQISDTPNRRLANAMLGLQGAVRTICQVEPPYEEGESLTAKRTIVDGVTGEVKKYKLAVEMAGSDFGTALSCSYDTKNIVDAHGKPDEDYDYTLLPRDKYLVAVLRHGDPHEPQFFASEVDVYSPEWSAEPEERLPNGGLADRQLNRKRAIYNQDGTYTGGAHATANLVFRRHRVLYRPLYSYEAPGLDKYVEITQGLLRKLLDGAAGKHKIRVS